MSNPVDSQIVGKPYKGPESYQVEDAELFFGRDLEAEQLIAKILSSRFTLMHSQSGAGKTSLLNARIMPGLESRGWIPVRILPQDDPIASTQLATLRCVLPPPEAEVLSVKRMLDALGKPGEDPTLTTLFDRYDDLPKRDRLRRSLIAPIKMPASDESDKEGDPSDFDRVMPLICRVLRSSLEIDALADHLSVIQQFGGQNRTTYDWMNGDTRASRLLEIVSDPQLRTSYSGILAQLQVPFPGLWAFFEDLVWIYGRRRSKFALVLIFDQFEELFTRFIDPGPISADHLTDLPHWQLRWSFFNELERLYRMELLQESSGEKERAIIDRVHLPIRYVIAMRSEYIAQLDPIRRFVVDLDESSYHLQLLSRDSAFAAIKEPAKIYGYAYTNDCYEAILRQLTKEDRYVEPAHLQMVCEKLWHERGRELSEIGLDNLTETNDDEGLPKIGLKTFVEDLKGAVGIFRSFFGDFLKDLKEKTGEDACLETLEMLEPLITRSRTRNIVERDQLVGAPFRNIARRRELLDNLTNRTILRIERRLGGAFVEITHEFLIGPILEALRDELYRNMEYSRFRSALSALERLESVDYHGGTDNLLLRSDFLALNENRHRVQLNDRITELMFRSAIVLGTNKDILRRWSGLFAESATTFDPADLLEERRLLSSEELRSVNEQRSVLTLTAEKIEYVLRSELKWAVDSDRENIEYWTKRIQSHGA